MNENRSLFWPLTLIAAGVIWLMISMGQIPAGNLWALTHIWPFVLIALGVGLILRGLWRPLGMAVTALVVIGAAGAIVFAPGGGYAAKCWPLENFAALARLLAPRRVIVIGSDADRPPRA